MTVAPQEIIKIKYLLSVLKVLHNMTINMPRKGGPPFRMCTKFMKSKSSVITGVIIYCHKLIF